MVEARFVKAGVFSVLLNAPVFFVRRRPSFRSPERRQAAD
jgi:hypothetical protein